MITSDRSIASLLGDLDGIPLGFPVGTSAGVLVGNPRNAPTSTTTESRGSKSGELYYLIALLFKRIKF